jgi:hypothetical protein
MIEPGKGELSNKVTVKTSSLGQSAGVKEYAGVRKITGSVMKYITSACALARAIDYTHFTRSEKLLSSVRPEFVSVVRIVTV